MAFASFLTTRRILALTIGAAALSVTTRQGAAWLETLRRGASEMDALTAMAVQSTLGRMSDNLHGLANEPAMQKNLQWNYANSVSQALSAAERTGEMEHLAIIDASCTSIANSSRQAVGAGDHWKPLCPTIGNTTKPEVVWNSKNGTPVLQVAVLLKDTRDAKIPARWIVAQTSLSEAWLKQNQRLANHMRQVAPEAALNNEDGKAASWKPLPIRLRFGAKISQSIVRQLNEISNLSFLLSLVLLGMIYIRLAWRSNQDSLTAEKNNRTLDQLVGNASSDDETKLSFSLGYAASEVASEGDLTPELVALDRLHRNRFALVRLDLKEKDLWIEDLECQLDESRDELNRLRVSALNHAQQKLLQEGLAKKVAASCQAIAAAHDDIVHYCKEPFLGLSNLIASWRHGSQTMGLKRFTRLLQESTDQLSRRSELENGVLAMTSVQERSFATVFELPARLKLCLQDLRPAVEMLVKGTDSDAKLACTTLPLGDTLGEVASMLGIARSGHRILVRLAQPELKILRLEEMVGQAFGKWFFYRAIEGFRDLPKATTVYLNVRGRNIRGETLELTISMVAERGTSHEAHRNAAEADGFFVDDGAMELANRLAISVGIDWSDKKNAGPITEPASNYFMVRIPLAALEGREGAATMHELVGMPSRPLDLTTEIAI